MVTFHVKMPEGRIFLCRSMKGRADSLATTKTGAETLTLMRSPAIVINRAVKIEQGAEVLPRTSKVTFDEGQRHSDEQ